MPKTKTGLFSETLEAGGLDSLTQGPWPPSTDHPHLSRPWGLHVPSQRWRVPRPPLGPEPISQVMSSAAGVGVRQVLGGSFSCPCHLLQCC